MRITFDPQSDAMYLTISEFQKDNNGQSDVNDFGVIIDFDASGNPRGYEFLSVRFQGVILDTLPQEVVRAVGVHSVGRSRFNRVRISGRLVNACGRIFAAGHRRKIFEACI